MADQLVTQVKQGEDLEKKQATLAAVRKDIEEKKAAAKSSQAPGKTENAKPSCWRMFCCLCRRSRKETPQELKQPEPTQKPADKELPRTPSTKQLEPTRQWLLPPQRPEHKGRKTLVLDLDETLIHSSFQPVPSPDYIITIELEGVHYKVYVQKRPGVDEFLEAVASKFEVIIFTASLDKCESRIGYLRP